MELHKVEIVLKCMLSAMIVVKKNELSLRIQRRSKGAAWNHCSLHVRLEILKIKKKKKLVDNGRNVV